MFKPQPSLFLLLACAACGSQFEAGAGAGAGSGSGAAAGESEAGASSAGAAGDESTGGRPSWGGSRLVGAARVPAARVPVARVPVARVPAVRRGSDCAALKIEYETLVREARVCDKGSTDECSASSSAPAVDGCGCPTLLNVKSESTPLALDKYKELQKGDCNNGPICDIACLPPTSASCAPSTTDTPESVCTGRSGIAN